MANAASATDYFSYTPVNGLQEVAIAAFVIFAAVITYKTIKSQSTKLMKTLVGTALAKTIGFICQTICIYNLSLGVYIAMTMFLLLPPNVLALFNYKTISKIVCRSNVSTSHLWLKPKFKY